MNENKKQVYHLTNGLLKSLDFNFVYKSVQLLAGDAKVYKKILEPVYNLKSKQKLSILDIGCGNGNIINYLPEDCSYIGCDFNADYIKNASKRHENRSVQFKLIDINISKPNFDQKFDVVLALGILHHLDDLSSKKLFQTALENLKEEGLLLTIDPTYVRNQNFIARFIISKDRGKSIRSSEQMDQLQRDFFSSRKHSIHHNLGNIPFSHLITICKK